MLIEIKTMRGPNRDHLIVGTDGLELGRAWPFEKKSHGFGVLIPGVYWDAHETPNRRGGSTGTSVPRLKDVPALVAKTLLQLVAIDAQIADVRQTLRDTVVEVKTADAKGAVLDWLVAKVCGIEVEIKKGATFGLMVGHNRYEPSIDSLLGLPIITSKVEMLGKNRDGTFFAVGQADHVKTASCGPTLLIAGLRMVVSDELGETSMVPACLLNA
jgi:hypothetical protein